MKELLIFHRSKARAASQRFVWTFQVNGEPISRSTEGYANREDCRRGAVLTFGQARYDGLEKIELWDLA